MDDRPHPGLLPEEKEEYWEMSVYLDGSGADAAWGWLRTEWIMDN